MANGIELATRVQTLEQFKERTELRLERLEGAYVEHSKETNRRLTVLEGYAAKADTTLKRISEDTKELQRDLKAEQQTNAVQNRDYQSIRPKLDSLTEIPHKVALLEHKWSDRAKLGGKITAIASGAVALWELIQAIWPG